MENTQLYKVVRDWLRTNVEGEDDALGEVTVVSFAICDIDTDIKRDTLKYGHGAAESAIRYKEEGATHVVRFLIVCDADLVDGEDFYFYLDNDNQFVLVNEPDTPALCGDTLDNGYKWVSERSLTYATDIGDEDE